MCFLLHARGTLWRRERARAAVVGWLARRDRVALEIGRIHTAVKSPGEVATAAAAAASEPSPPAMPRRSGQRSTTSPARSRGATVESIFIASSNAAPMKPVKTATLIAGVGIEGDRYELKTGTYSAKFLYEPGRNLTLVSADGVEAQVAKTKMEPLQLSALRRNLVVRGISAEAGERHGRPRGGGGLGAALRPPPHRAVPISPGAVRAAYASEHLWDVCGVNCEIIQGGTVRVGDTVAVVPNTYQPKRATAGHKPEGFFIRPSQRTAEMVRKMPIPVLAAMKMALIDPVGFQRAEDGYTSVGCTFFPPKAHRAGALVIKWRNPVLVAVLALLWSVWLAYMVRVTRSLHAT